MRAAINKSFTKENVPAEKKATTDSFEFNVDWTTIGEYKQHSRQIAGIAAKE